MLIWNWKDTGWSVITPESLVGAPDPGCVKTEARMVQNLANVSRIRMGVYLPVCLVRFAAQTVPGIKKAKAILKDGQCCALSRTHQVADSSRFQALASGAEGC